MPRNRLFLLLGVGGGLAVLVTAVVVVIWINSNTGVPKPSESPKDNKDGNTHKLNSDTIVQGTVTYKGNALNGGAIDVNSSPPRGAGINPDGTFRMKGVSPGKHRVKFVPLGDPKEIEPQKAVTDKSIQDFATSGVEIEIVRGKANEVHIDFK